MRREQGESRERGKRERPTESTFSKYLGRERGNEEGMDRGSGEGRERGKREEREREGEVLTQPLVVASKCQQQARSLSPVSSSWSENEFSYYSSQPWCWQEWEREVPGSSR